MKGLAPVESGPAKAKSRQQRWIEKKVAKGRCGVCGRLSAKKKNGKRARACTRHLAMARENKRTKLAVKRRWIGAVSYGKGWEKIVQEMEAKIPAGVIPSAVKITDPFAP